jgi:bacterioferritin-associated ferredoxin
MPLIFLLRVSRDSRKAVEAPMYVCNCRAIRERDVDAAVRAGARRPVDVFRACGKSPQCGSCACEMRERISHTIAREQASPQTVLAAD